MGEILALIGVIVTLVIGIPALFYQRRQTQLAEIDKTSSKTNTDFDVLARIIRDKKIRVGLVNYPPFVDVCTNQAELSTGLYVELIRRFCESEGIKVDFKQVRFGSAVEDIIEDKADVILSIFQTPKRSRKVDFCSILRTVTVSAVVRKTENRIRDTSDLKELKELKFIVCKGEIGHELLEDNFEIPKTRLNIYETNNVEDIIQMVAAEKADIAIADTVSCNLGIHAHGDKSPKLKPIFRRQPLYRCYNGLMIKRDQKPLAHWLNEGLKTSLNDPEIESLENDVLEKYNGIITKV